jgi:hypothetical protein
MTRKLGAKITHHCWCGKTGHCRKHSTRCEKHQIDHYATGKCLACEGEEAAAARKAYQKKQEQKKAEEEKKKKKAADSWCKLKRK